MRAHLAELLRRQGIDAGAAPPTGPVAPIALARRIVREQSLGQDPQP